MQPVGVLVRQRDGLARAGAALGTLPQGWGVAMAAMVVRASGGPSPSRSARAKGWVGPCALSGELPTMPFASLVLARAALLTPRRAVCC